MEQLNRKAASLGLRHVLEDGIALLEGRLSDDDRRRFVIGDLAELLQKAERGVQVAEGEHLFMRAGDLSAFKAYSLFFKYLNEAYRDALTNKISSTSTTLSKLTKHEDVSADDQGATREFFQRLLDKLNRDEAYSRQREPETIGLR